MAWILGRPAHTTYKRNFVNVIVSQLKFHPILSIEKRVSEFQDAMREDFPGFRKETVKEIRPSSLGIDILETPRFIFTSADQNQILSLATDYIALESKSHHTRDEFLPLLTRAYEALYSFARPIQATRLGLRYVNIIDRSRIEEDLGHSTPWERVISSDFLALPSCVNSSDTSMGSEITSPINGGPGKLTLRYGLGPHHRREDHVFTFDIDRYSEELLPESLESLQEALQSYSDDIFSLLVTCIGEDLKKWMTH